jgi:uncharacterized protein (TIGR02099 family)
VIDLSAVIPKRLRRLSYWLLLAVAIALLIFRLFVSWFAGQPGLVERWLSDTLGQPVSLDALEARWHGWTPELRVRTLQVWDPSQRQSVLRLGEVGIYLGLLDSLFSASPVAKRVRLQGVQISLYRDARGGIQVDGLSQPGRQSVRRDRLQRLRVPREILIESSTLSWRDASLDTRTVEITGVNLHFKRRSSKKFKFRASGNFGGGAIVMAADGKGNLKRPDWRGQAYIRLHDVPLQSLGTLSAAPLFSRVSGTAGLELWSALVNGKPQDISAHAAIAKLNLDPAEPRQVVDNLEADLQAARSSAELWRGDITNIRMQSSGQQWDAEKVQFSAKNQTQLVAHIPSLRLEPLLGWLAPQWRFLAPAGELHDLRYRYDAQHAQGRRHNLQAQLNQASIRSSTRFPKLENAAADLRLSETQIEAILPAQSLRLLWPERLPKPVSIDAMHGRVLGQWQDAGWVLSIPGLSLKNRDIGLTIHGTAHGSPATGPITDLAADIDYVHLEHVADYVPSSLPLRAQEWLSRSIKGGRIPRGHAVLKGPLRQFPFERSPGDFSIALDLQDGLLQFLPTWPAVEGIQGQIVFKGPSLSIHSDNAKMLGNHIGTTDVVIPSLYSGERILQINGVGDGAPAQAMDLVMHSPLRERVGKHLEGLEIGGKLGLRLDLTIPLKIGEETHVHGWLRFSGNSLAERRLKLNLTDLKGELEFTKQHWFGQGLSAHFLDQPTHLDFEVINNTTSVTLHGAADRAFLKKQLNGVTAGAGDWAEEYQVLNIPDGKTVPWIAKLQLPQQGRSPRLELESDLHGMRVAIPAPFAKTVDDKRALRVYATLGKTDEPLRFSYGDSVRGDLKIRRSAKGIGLDGAHLYFGPEAIPIAPRPAWWLGGSIARVSAGEWLELFSKIKYLRNYSQRPLPAIDADLNLVKAEIFGQTFKNFQLNLSHETLRWLLKFVSPNAVGRVTVARDLNKPQIDASLERLQITKELTEGIHQRFDPRSFPSLTLRCVRLRFNDLELGSLSLAAQPKPSGVHIEPINWSSPNFNITGNGDWTQAENHNERSQFRLKVRAPKLSQLLSSFGFSPPKIKDSATELEIDATWPNTPAHFSLAKLEGTMRLSIKDGRFVEVDPSAGRVFGLLSLQALPRRLSLDFRDLFKKGLSFDTIQGSFRFKHGHAFTKDLYLDGPTIRIDTVGRTGLVDLDYDQTVTVTPPVSSTLPAASAVFGPIGAAVGGGVWLAGKVFREIPENIDRMFSYQYSMKGRWENPIIERTGKGKRIRTKDKAIPGDGISAKDGSAVFPREIRQPK